MPKSIKLMAAAALLAATSAFSQSAVTWKLQCQSVGNSAPEPLDDRESHAVQVIQYSCRAEGGPLDGAALTGTGIYEWDKGVASGLSHHGLYRMPGASMVYENSEGKMVLTMADGKVTGWSSVGEGRIKMAAGKAAVLAGRSYTYGARSTGPGQFFVSGKVQ